MAVEPKITIIIISGFKFGGIATRIILVGNLVDFNLAVVI